MSVYVMSDIHGEHELFKMMLDEIGFTDSDELYILGDVLDRGKRPIDVIMYIKDKTNITMIKGNHEKMFLDYVYAEDDYMGYTSEKEILLNNGGGTTINQYNKLSREDRRDVRTYINNLDNYVLLEKFILVHSGLNLTGIRDYPIDKILDLQCEEDLLWSREEFYTRKGLDGYIIIFGHTPTAFIHGTDKLKIWYDGKYKDKIGIDCGATFSKSGGKLACLRLNDMEEYYVG